MALVLLGAPAMAAAQPRPAVGSGCRIEAPNHEFDEYSTLDPFPTLGRSAIAVDCRGDSSLPTSVTISAGDSGNPQERVMRSGNNDLRYNLYVDVGRRIVAGDGTGGSSPLIPRLPFQDHNIYLLFGTIFSLQSVPGGDYSDRIRVDVEF